MHIIGLDIGTTSLCGICCDTESGNIVEKITIPNQAVISGKHIWERLQDAEMLVEAVKEIVGRLMKNTSSICGIGVTGQMHGIVYVDERGEAVSPLYTWQDGRGEQTYKDGKTYVQWLNEKTGYSLATGYGSVTHFYNTVNGLVPATARKFCTIHDLAAMALTEEVVPVLHPSDAASLGMYDLHAKQFDTATIAEAGMEPSFFPNVKDGYFSIGRTRQGIPVAVAIGDNQASVLGAVKDMDNSVLVNVGTGSQVSCIVSGVPENCTMDCRPLAEDLYLLVGAPLCGGRAYAILEQFLRKTAELICGQRIDSAYPAMSKVMDAYSGQNQDLIVDTSFSGTRQEPEKRGIIRNIDIDNFTMENLCNGFMNGMVEELYVLFQQMTPFLNKMPGKIVGSGNGIHLNKHLALKFAEKFGMPLRIPANREEAAFGAALFGLTVAKGLSGIREAQGVIRYGEFGITLCG